MLSVENALLEGVLKKGDALPSVNQVSNRFGLSRDTVFTALNELKTRGIIESVPGKGFFVTSEHIKVKQRIFLLFDELNAFKEDLYNAFVAHLGGDVQVDIFFHHFNEEMFKKLILDSLGNYSYYVIMPANLKHTGSVVNKLPSDKVYILDQINQELSSYPAIYQNFETDIFNSLMEARPMIEKYRKMVLLFPEKRQPTGMLYGFQNYRRETAFNYEIIDTLDGRTLVPGEVYLVLDDQSLIFLIKKLKDQGLVLGSDIGIISYNDTLLKEIVEGGITTISTDFKAMGKRLAEMIRNKEHIKIENPNSLIIRNSL